MSTKPEQQKPEEQPGKVNVGDLARKEDELKDGEARQIQGGGGASGAGVDIRSRKHIGEEIPQ